MTLDRALSDFTVELEVYSGPYEGLLALILKEELEIFEVPLRELVGLYLSARDPGDPNALERDTDFAGSAAALVLLKSRTLSPLAGEGEDEEGEALSPEQLAERLANAEVRSLPSGAPEANRPKKQVGGSDQLLVDQRLVDRRPGCQMD